MSKLEVFDTTLQKTQLWLNELSKECGWTDPHLSYLGLRAVLHALRDRLTVETAVKLGSQLPLLVRGIYYEGWVPTKTPIKTHSLDDFLIKVVSHLGHSMLMPHVALVTRQVFSLLSRHISEGEIDHLKKVLPESLASLWNIGQGGSYGEF